MEVKTNEIAEKKIVSAVKYAISTRFSLDQLCQLLVTEGGVDLDTLARIIRENRGSAPPRGARAGEAGQSTEVSRLAEVPLQIIDRSKLDQLPSERWFGIKIAG
ncbi:MAG: hypothetical protein ABJM29_04235 [Rhizobiaceae bacterium]